jgi:hypothetical protein
VTELPAGDPERYMSQRRLVIVQADSGDRLSVVEDPSGMYWKALNLPGSYALISWWESGDWHEELAW